jgi:hypothetical protein
MRVGRRCLVTLAGCVIATAGMAGFSASARAADCTRYASPSGSDSAAGTLASPLRTAQELIDSLSAGETGCLRAGTYAQTVWFERSGSATSPITLRSYPGERARLVGNAIIRANWLRLSDVDIEGDGSMNTIKIYSSDVVIERNDITNRLRGQSCMILGSSSAGQAQRTIVRANRFHDCGSPLNTNKDHSIYASNVLDARITDNVFTNSAGYTIQLYPNAQRTLVAHNVIDGGPDTIRGGVVFGGDTRDVSRDNVVTRNIITYAADANLYSYWGSTVGTGNVARKNCLWGAGDEQIDSADGGFRTVGNRVANPRFVDRAARDYRLSSASACRALVGYDTAARLGRLSRCRSAQDPACGRPRWAGACRCRRPWRRHREATGELADTRHRGDR